MSALAERLLHHLAQSGLVARGSRCLVALSGGGDSVALLHLLSELRDRLDLAVCAAHLDHGLREESASDRRFAQDLCQSLGIPFLWTRARVREHAARHGVSLEAAGRRLRYRFLFRSRERLGCDLVLTAHTADDQAETVLLRLVAGTGLRGLGGIRPRRRDGVVRPLLLFTREELRAHLREVGLEWREDATNAVAGAPRTRVRLLLLPLLRQWNPRIVQALDRTARAARLDEGYLARRARRHLGDLEVEDGGLRLDPAILSSMPRPLRVRALRMALARLRCRPEARHLELLEDLLGGPEGAAWTSRWRPCPQAAGIPGAGREAAAPSPTGPPGPGFLSLVPGSTGLPEWGLEFTCTPADEVGPSGPWQVWLDVDSLEGPLEVRSRCPGDRFRPAGGQGSTTLKKFLHACGVERDLRDRVAVVCSRGRIVWVVGYRAAQDFLATPSSRRILHLYARPSCGRPYPAPDRSPGRLAEAPAPMTTSIPVPGPVIVTQEQIQQRVRELAAEISRDYQGRPLHLLAVLRGALPFLADLSRLLTLDVSFDFLAVTRDGSNGQVRLIKDLDRPVEGRTVLLVEDIVNEGTTLQYLLETLRLRRPADLRVCTMFDRPSRRCTDVRPDYVGLVLDERFVVGYGLDYQQIYRNLPYLAELSGQD